MPRVTHGPAGAHRSFTQPRPRVTRQRLATILADTAERYPGCRCELHDAMSMDALIALGAGCRVGHVCDRLAAVRRRCGL